MNDANSDEPERSRRAAAMELAADLRSVSRENRLRLFGAGVAYYLFNALVALLLFAFLGLYATGSFDLVVDSYGTLAGVDVERVGSTLDAVIGDGVGRRRAVLIAGGIFLWSSFKLIRAVNTAFADIYGTRGERSGRKRLVHSLIAFATVVVAVPAVSLVVVTLMVATDAPSVRILGVPLLFAVFAGVFAPMYYLFPGEETTLAEALPGIAFAAVTWTGCTVLFRLYVTTAESIRLYGAVGAVLLILTWLYVGGLILLVGAVVNAVLAGRVAVDGNGAGE